MIPPTVEVHAFLPNGRNQQPPESKHNSQTWPRVTFLNTHLPQDPKKVMIMEKSDSSRWNKGRDTKRKSSDRKKKHRMKWHGILGRRVDDQPSITTDDCRPDRGDQVQDSCPRFKSTSVWARFQVPLSTNYILCTSSSPYFETRSHQAAPRSLRMTVPLQRHAIQNSTTWKQHKPASCSTGSGLLSFLSP